MPGKVPESGIEEKSAAESWPVKDLEPDETEAEQVSGGMTKAELIQMLSNRTKATN